MSWCHKLHEDRPQPVAGEVLVELPLRECVDEVGNPLLGVPCFYRIATPISTATKEKDPSSRKIKRLQSSSALSASAARWPLQTRLLLLNSMLNCSTQLLPRNAAVILLWYTSYLPEQSPYRAVAMVDLNQSEQLPKSALISRCVTARRRPRINKRTISRNKGMKTLVEQLCLKDASDSERTYLLC